MMLQAGQMATGHYTLRQEDFDRFAALSGDDNPIHVDPAFAATTRFGRTVAHGMYLYGLIAATLQAHFPGALQAEQSLMFPTPAYAGETVTVSLSVLAVDNDAATIETLVRRPNGELACRGETVVTWEAV